MTYQQQAGWEADIKAEEAKQAASQAVGSATEATQAKAVEVGEASKATDVPAREKVYDAAVAAKDKTVEIAQAAKEKVVEAATVVRDKTVEVAHAAKEKFSGAPTSGGVTQEPPPDLGTQTKAAVGEGLQSAGAATHEAGTQMKWEAAKPSI